MTWAKLVLALAELLSAVASFVRRRRIERAAEDHLINTARRAQDARSSESRAAGDSARQRYRSGRMPDEEIDYRD